MNDDFLVTLEQANRRLIRAARRNMIESQEYERGNIRAFIKGMVAGLKLALLEARFLHNEIKRRRSQGYQLVWLSEEEIEILNTFNP